MLVLGLMLRVSTSYGVDGLFCCSAQDLEERQAREITILKQRVKHLLFEHQSESTESKTDGVVAVKGAQDAHRESEEELKRDRRALATQLREMDAAHEAFVRELRREQDRQLTELRLDFERESRELQMQYDHRLEVTRRCVGVGVVPVGPVTPRL